MAKLAILASMILMICPGCSSKNLIFTTYTTVGLDISATDAKPTKAVFGYKRFEGAIVPVDPTDETKEAMSVYAGINLKNQWLQGLDLVQVFATGKAAENAATNPKGFAELLQKADE